MSIAKDSVQSESTAFSNEEPNKKTGSTYTEKDAVVWKDLIWHQQEAGRGANGIIYRLTYRNKEMALKYQPAGDLERTKLLQNEVHVYKTLENLQGNDKFYFINERICALS
jgi:predicted Ser/Thr protein kinase